MNDIAFSRAAVRNRLLVRMSPEDWAPLAPHLEMVTLKERQVVELPDKPITHVYFADAGLVSVLAVNHEDHRIEVGVIGNEGITGVPLILGDDRGQHSAYLQIGGNGWRMPAAFVEVLRAVPRCAA